MEKKTFILILGCFLTGVLFICFLYVLSFKPNSQKNGFKRSYFSGLIVHKTKINLEYANFYIAGLNASTVYLGNFDDPTIVYVLDNEFSEIKHLKTNFVDSIKFFWRYSRLQVDSPNVYLTEGTTPTLFHTTLDDLRFKLFMKNSCHFTSSILGSKNLAFFKSIEESKKEHILVKQTNRPPFIQKASHILQRQVDGLFSTDGMFKYDPESSKLIYLYYYRNEFICLDTNLRIIYRQKTIDTNTHAKLIVGTIPSENKVALASPPLFINKQSCLSRDKLFIHCSLIADNEDIKKFKENAVIDVYSLQNGQYFYSFYIPVSNQEQFSDFRIFGNQLVVLIGQYLYLFTIAM